MRKIFTKIHLWLSLPLGIIIAIICFTGAILVWENEVLEARYPSRYFVEKIEGEILSPSALVKEVHAALPDSMRVNRLKIYGEADRNWKFYLNNGEVYFVNPYTGQLAGKDERSVFFSQTMRLHRFLLHSYTYGKDYPWGKRVVGISTIGFIFILLTGLFIWFPRNRKSLKNRLSVKTTAGSFRFWYDVHVAGGFYTAIFLLVMALTGLTWSFPWYRTAFYSLLGAAPVSNTSGKKVTKVDGAIDYVQWDNVYGEMKNRYPDYTQITIQNERSSVSTARYGNTGATDKFLFSGADGRITEEELYESSSAYSRMRGWVWALHSGEWGGITTRILSCLAALIGVVLVFTGYYFWVKKKVRKRHKLR